MAVVNTKSTPVGNADASPIVFNNSNVDKGVLKEVVANLEAVSGDSIGSTYRMVRVPSNARISQVLLSCDAITTCTGDVGVYKAAVDGGAVVDVDHFASANALSAALSNSNITHEADPADAGAGFGLADSNKMLWESLGLTSDPKISYDIVVTLTAAAGSAGTVGLKVQYAQ